MGIIRFFIERYNLKEFFFYELNLFHSFTKSFIYLFYTHKQIVYRVILTIAFIILLFVVILLQKYFIILFFLIVIKNIYHFFNYKLFFLTIQLKFCIYKYKFFLIFFKLVKKFYSFKFLRTLPRIIFYYFVISKLNIPKYIQFFLIYNLPNEKISLWDSFFLKFFFNIIEPVSINYFLFLLNNMRDYYVFNRIIFIHYKLMSIPMENPQFGNVQIAWLAYAGPVTFYFFLVRWNYYSDSDKKFIARHYYREKTVLSYLNNFLFILYFYFNRAISIFKWLLEKLFKLVTILLNFNLNIVFCLLKKQNFFFFIKLFIRFAIIFIFIYVFFFFASPFKIFLPNIIYNFFKVVKKPIRIYKLIRLFFRRVRQRIRDRIVFVPKFLSFGRGVKFFPRFRYKEFFFVINIHYWTRRDFTRRIRLFFKFKKICIRKRRAGFKLVFRSFFLLKYSVFFLKFFFLIVDYVIFYPTFWIFLKIFWSFCGGLCFVI